MSKGIFYKSKKQKFQSGGPMVGANGQYAMNFDVPNQTEAVAGRNLPATVYRPTYTGSAQPGRASAGTYADFVNRIDGRGWGYNPPNNGANLPATRNNLPSTVYRPTYDGSMQPGRAPVNGSAGTYADFAGRIDGRGWGYNPPNNGANLPATRNNLPAQIPGNGVVGGEPTPYGPGYSNRYDVSDAQIAEYGKRGLDMYGRLSNLGSGAGMAGAAFGLGAAAISQIEPQYREIQHNMQDPRYNTTSKVSDYTQNPYPGQQVGTGQNTGTKPEYNVGFRYPYLEHKQEMHSISRVHGNQSRSLFGNPNEAENLESKISGAVGAPVRALMNSGLNRYNAVRDYMETPNKGAVSSAEMTPGGGKGTVDAETQRGYVQHQNQNKIKSDKVGKNDWQFQDNVIANDILGVDTNDNKSVRKLQTFLADSNFDIGEFGAGGVDGKFGDMTRGATRNFGNLISSDKGIRQLKKESPHLRDMWQSSADKAGKGATQEQINQQFRKDVAENIARYSGDEGTNQALAAGTQGRKGNKTMGYGASAVQQGNNTSNKDAYEKSSSEGAKSYKDKKGIIRKTGKQGSSYKAEKKKPQLKSQKLPASSNATSRGEAFKKARKEGKAEFTWKGKKYNTRQSGESDAAWRKSIKNRSSATKSVSNVKSKGTSESLKRTSVKGTVSSGADFQAAVAKEMKNWQKYSKDRNVAEQKIRAKLRTAKVLKNK